MLKQLRESLAIGQSTGPGVGELPAGVPLPRLDSTASLSVSRYNYQLFNTGTQNLDTGIATISAGSSMSMSLE